MSFSEPALATHRHTTPPQQHKPSAGAPKYLFTCSQHLPVIPSEHALCHTDRLANGPITQSRLHDTEHVENNTYDEETQDDNDRGNFPLEQVHAQEGQQQSCKSGYQ